VSAPFSDFLRDYTFELPEELIAQSPPAERGDSRLLVVRREPERGLPRFEDLAFRDLPSLAREDGALRDRLWVRNVSKVFPARFYARRPTGGRHEIVLVRESEESGVWEAIVRGVSSFRYPQTLSPEKAPHLSFVATGPTTLDLRALGELRPLLEEIGEMPLPPYIRSREATRDRDRYQTIWAAAGAEKSVAAPTASLHFDRSVVAELENAGARFVDTLLHVGPGTFAPVRVERLSEHELHEEEIAVPRASLETLRREAALSSSPSFVAIGTTALRNLESLSLRDEALDARVRLRDDGDGGLRGATRLFVRPGHEFRYARALLTNFHLPESTLFVLVATFAGSLALARDAYAHAVSHRYRFFSYGDASLWI